MSEERSSGWKRTEGSEALERTSVHPLGFRRYERSYPTYFITRVRDSYSDSFRRVYAHGNMPDDDPWARSRRNSWPEGQTQTAAFADEKNRSVLLIKTSSEDEVLTLAFLDRKDTKGKTEEANTPLHQENLSEDIALIVGHYQEGNLKSLTLQAGVVTPDIEDDSMLEGPGRWKTSLPQLIELVRYKKNNDPDSLELEKEIVEMNYISAIEKKLPSKEHPLIAEVEGRVNEVMAVLICAVPADDRKDAIEALDAIGLRATLQKSLLDVLLKEQVGSVKDIKGFSLDDFLDLDLQLAVDGLNDESYFSKIGRLLKVDKITPLDFSWKQLDVESKGYVYESETTVEQGTATFGQEIPAQENSFVLEDDGKHMIVSCLKRGKLIWKSTLPKQLDSKSIQQTISDLDSDFRQVKPLLTGASINLFK